jgi:hypothetical protein
MEQSNGFEIRTRAACRRRGCSCQNFGAWSPDAQPTPGLLREVQRLPLKAALLSGIGAEYIAAGLGQDGDIIAPAVTPQARLGVPGFGLPRSSHWRQGCHVLLPDLTAHESRLGERETVSQTSTSASWFLNQAAASCFGGEALSLC